VQRFDDQQGSRYAVEVKAAARSSQHAARTKAGWRALYAALSTDR
jgi:hypothetical protein